jgi:hypothetical protein
MKYTSTTHHRSSQLILGSKQMKKSILDNDNNDDSLKIPTDFLTSLMRVMPTLMLNHCRFSCSRLCKHMCHIQ